MFCQSRKYDGIFAEPRAIYINPTTRRKLNIVAATGLAIDAVFGLIWIACEKTL
jgi:hypothetical protein